MVSLFLIVMKFLVFFPPLCYSFRMSTVNIEVKKNANENNANLLRRFSRRIQESGIIPRVKSIRYNQRPQSKLAQKLATLKRITKRKDLEKLKKLGKMS